MPAEGCISKLSRPGLKMGIKKLLLYFFLVGALSAIAVFYCCPELRHDREPPKLDDEWWGRGPLPTDATKFPKDDPLIKKYVVNIEESVLKDLKSRLNNTRFVEPLENAQFHYGFNDNYLKEVVEYWKSKYDWRKNEKVLNKFSHFVTQIEGISVHFIHEKPDLKGKKLRVLPLLLSHGWPGSVYEFYKILPMLTTPREGRDYVFEVICPSIPGYGFSEAPHQAGFSAASAARLFSKLMDRLGHKTYYVQGGDWGSVITSILSKAYPERVIGVHVNFMSPRIGVIGYLKYALGSMFPSHFMTPDEEARMYPLKKILVFFLEESGYFHIQATKPDTVGSGLADSPAGLAAYVLEKFSTASDRNSRNLPDGGLTKKFTMDELLTNVMIYWCTNSMASSQRLYKEALNEKMRSYDFDSLPLKVPSGIAAFPNEVIMFPKSFIQHRFKNLVSYTSMPRGGHFAALEEPKLLADDLWEFVVNVENFKKKQQ